MSFPKGGRALKWGRGVPAPVASKQEPAGATLGVALKLPTAKGWCRVGEPC